MNSSIRKTSVTARPSPEVTCQAQALFGLTTDICCHTMWPMYFWARWQMVPLKQMIHPQLLLRKHNNNNFPFEHSHDAYLWLFGILSPLHCWENVMEEEAAHEALEHHFRLWLCEEKAVWV
ncbi:uncharacterized protein LOC144211700 [Stigmatopora nigra]